MNAGFYICIKLKQKVLCAKTGILCDEFTRHPLLPAFLTRTENKTRPKKRNARSEILIRAAVCVCVGVCGKQASVVPTDATHTAGLWYNSWWRQSVSLQIYDRGGFSLTRLFGFHVNTFTLLFYSHLPLYHEHLHT